MAEVAGLGGVAAATASAPTTPNQPGQGQASSTPPTPAPAPKVWKHKVDGKEVTWQNEQELLNDAGLGKAAFKRMEEASQIRQQAQTFLERFKKNPMEALEDPALGLSEQQRRDVIEQYYAKKYLAQDQMSPEQREIARLKADAAARDARDKARTDQETSRQREAQKAQLVQQYQQTIIQALETGGVPKTEFTVSRMAFYMGQAQRNKLNVSMDQIVNTVKADYRTHYSQLTQAMSPEQLVEFLGPDMAKKVNQYHLAQWRAKQAGATGTTPPAPKQAVGTPKPEPDRSGEGWKSVSKYWTR